MVDVIKFLLGLGFVFFVVMVISYILYAIGLMKMFHKMGQPAWKAFIPFLNDYTLIDRTWDAKYFWIMLLLAVAIRFLGGMSDSSMMSAVIAVGSLALGIIEIYSNYMQSKAFGCGIGMALILTLFPAIGTMLLGYGSYEYRGPQEMVHIV